MSKVLGIEHVQLALPEGREDEARGFYGRLLGIPEVPKPAHLARRGGVWFEHDGLKVHLGVDPHFVPATKAHPAFIVENLRGLAAALNDAGYETRDDASSDGWFRIYVHDPFGNRIELLEPRS